MEQRSDRIVVKTIGLKKTYFLEEVKVEALKGVDIEIKKGSFVSVTGASGSGKTTFMNILGCLDIPTEGKYLLEGNDVTLLAPDRLAEIRNNKIGFIFQSFNLLSRTTALENVELPMIYSTTNNGIGKEKAMQLLDMMGLKGFETHHPQQLSGGQQQRVAIARALVNTPDIILADEPTGNLDSKTSIEIMSILTRLNEETGVTIILVTHEPDIAAYAKRIINFKDGLIVSDKWINGDR
ncbi:MAG: ABC transporter ATP-binding protein [Deltaproteobacteria bacterium]|nr:ABC transporter ATP-binding protein [Deltaproteobacteria bacterium]MCL5792902.1 ABC transporter ATP-binding protein [Deltaproteobacteria bacterium]